MDCSEEVGVSRVFKGHTVSTSIITVLFSSKPLSITYHLSQLSLQYITCKHINYYTYPDKPPNKKFTGLGIVLRRVDALCLEVTTTAGVLDCAMVAAKRLQTNLQRGVRAGILYQCYQSNHDITSHCHGCLQMK